MKEKRKLALVILSLLLQDDHNIKAFLELINSPFINGPVKKYFEKIFLLIFFFLKIVMNLEKMEKCEFLLKRMAEMRLLLCD